MSVRLHRFLLGVVALSAWAGLAVQFAVSGAGAAAQGQSVWGGLLAPLGFFTIWTNLVAAALATAAVRCPAWLAEPRLPILFGGAAGAIAIVAIVYEAVLRRAWDPQGWQKVADVLLHTVTPGLFIAAWLYLMPKGRLRAAHIPLFMLYPLGYLAFALTRGALTGFYPYPFLDVGRLGGGAAALNCAVVALLFLAMFLLVLFIDRRLGQKAPV